MRKWWTVGAILGLMLMALPSQAQDRGNRDERIQKLEREIADLRSELKKLQGSTGSAQRGPDRKPEAKPGNRPDGRPETRNDQARRPGGPQRPEARGFGQGFRGYGRFQQNPWGPGFGRGNPWGPPGWGWGRGQNFRQGWQSPAPWRGGFNRSFAPRRNFQDWGRDWNQFAPRRNQPGFGPPAPGRRPGFDRPGQPPARNMERGPDRPRRDPPPVRERSDREQGEDNRQRPPA